MLRHAVHLRNGQAHLFNAAALLVRGRGNLAHDIGHAGHGGDDFLHGGACLANLLRTGIHPADGVLDKPFDLFRRLRAAARQRTDFTCNNRKTTALFPGACRFHRGVKRQNVGLERDAVDHAGNMRNLLRTVGDFVHGANHVIHDVTAARGRFRGVFRQQRGLTGVIGVLLNRRGQLFHAGGGLFERGGLLLGAGGKIVASCGNFACAGVDGIGTSAYGADGGHQRLLHLMQACGQLTHLIAARDSDLLRQVAPCNGANMVHNGVEWF